MTGLISLSLTLNPVLFAARHDTLHSVCVCVLRLALHSDQPSLLMQLLTSPPRPAR